MRDVAWTPAHDAYCLASKLEGCSKLIWQWLINHPEEQEEPDLSKFNNWVEKYRGKAYHRDTIKLAWNKLIESKIIRPLKFFTWKIWRIALRPITLLVNPASATLQRKSSREDDSIRGLRAATPIASYTSTNSSSKINPQTKEILAECEAAGIEFEEKQQPRVLEFPLEKVRIAIAYFLFRHPDEKSRAKVRSPQGWLIHSLCNDTWLTNKSFLGHVFAYNILPQSCIELLERCIR